MNTSSDVSTCRHHAKRKRLFTLFNGQEEPLFDSGAFGLFERSEAENAK
ncbi:MAG: hypothetical protein GY822_20350 [Deltaproteobacteria bacterium]|nr:hypothetical protein [Deltaproteobacteria bacterium]